MSKPVNPFSIGAFIVGSVTLLAVAILVFGGNQVFKQKLQFVIFFDSTLNGLNIGAPVTMQGVQIGTVTEIALMFDAKQGKISKPVVVEINPELMRDAAGNPLQVSMLHNQNHQIAQNLIDIGLKARLETQSLLTGLLYVEFNFYKDEALRLTGMNYKDLAELPSVPTTVDQIRHTADEIMTKIRALPLEEMVKDLAQTLREVRDLMRSKDLKDSLAALAKTLEETQRLTETLNASSQPLMGNLNSALSETRTSMREIRKEMLIILNHTEKGLGAATQAIEASQHAVNSVEDLASPDSVLGEALSEIRDASRSLKDLTDYLERQPDSIVFGKP